MNVGRRTGLAAGALATAAIATVGTGWAFGEGPTTAAGSTPATLVLTADMRKATGHETDVKPKGESAGDQFQSYAPLVDDTGKSAGRADLVGVGVPNGRGMLFGVLKLPGGQITFQGSITDIDNSVYAITGGTGSYASATGTVTSKEVDKASVSLAVALG